MFDSRDKITMFFCRFLKYFKRQAKHHVNLTAKLNEDEFLASVYEYYCLESLILIANSYKAGLCCLKYRRKNT